MPALHLSPLAEQKRRMADRPVRGRRQKSPDLVAEPHNTGRISGEKDQGGIKILPAQDRCRNL